MRGLFEWLGRRRWIPAIAAPIDRVAYRLLGRGLTVGVPTLILRHIGRTSGDQYSSPLFYLRRGDSLVVLATNYGREEPHWSLNLRKNPEVEIQVGRDSGRYVARMETESRVVDEVWASFIELFSNYSAYRSGSDRDIPVWFFDPE